MHRTRRLRSTIGALALLAILLLGACGPAPTATPIPTETPVPTATVPPGIWQPLSERDCEDLAHGVGRALHARPEAAVAPFQDPLTGEGGGACSLTIQGTGAQFASPMDVLDALRPVLEESGWREDLQYAAGGPTGMALGYRAGNQICLISAAWKPGEGADCPDDTPIEECGLSPDQQLYTITVLAARQ